MYTQIYPLNVLKNLPTGATPRFLLESGIKIQQKVLFVGFAWGKFRDLHPASGPQVHTLLHGYYGGALELLSICPKTLGAGLDLYRCDWGVGYGCVSQGRLIRAVGGAPPISRIEHNRRPPSRNQGSVNQEPGRKKERSFLTTERLGLIMLEGTH